MLISFVGLQFNSTSERVNLVSAPGEEEESQEEEEEEKDGEGEKEGA